MSRAPAENQAALLDATELARTGSTWECNYSMNSLPRLQEGGVADAQASVQLRFALWGGRPAIHGHLTGCVEMVCQRCLKPMQQTLDESFELILLAAEGELEGIPESYEALVLDAARLDVRWLVEEQLLLALPLIPRHEDAAECGVAFADAEGDAQAVVENSNPDTAGDNEGRRPFQNLRELLRNKS